MPAFYEELIKEAENKTRFTTLQNSTIGALDNLKRRLVCSLQNTQDDSEHASVSDKQIKILTIRNPNPAFVCKHKGLT